MIQPFLTANKNVNLSIVVQRASCAALLCFLIISQALAIQSSPSVNFSNSHDVDVSILGKIKPLGNDYQNSIELLNNRFRIDSDVSAVTLVFFREYGSAPIVLVRPDGSKLYLEKDQQDDSFQWFETGTYDMISLNQPMPGPWQAVGKILPESRVLVIAGITLNAEAIPSPIYSGETLKQTAFLENAGTKIDMDSFRDVVTLSIEFVSTNNPSYSNFGLGSRSIAIFEDNGQGLDEQEGDGEFTGQFNLNIVEGEWRPVFTIRTPLFSREQVNDNIELLPNPILVAHQIIERENRAQTQEFEGNNTFLLEIDVDRSEIDINSVIIDGTIRHPTGENEPFYVTQSSAHTKEVALEQKKFGIHQVNMTVFAKTLSGRDVVITVPEYSFIVNAPVIEKPEEIELEPTLGLNDSTSIQNAQLISANDLDVENVDDGLSTILIAALVNLFLLIIGGVTLFLIVEKRKNPHASILAKFKFRLPKISFKKKPQTIDDTKAVNA